MHTKQTSLWKPQYMLCHDMETLSALLSLCEGNPPVTKGQQCKFDVFFIHSLDKSLDREGDVRCCEGHVMLV